MPDAPVRSRVLLALGLLVAIGVFVAAAWLRSSEPAPPVPNESPATEHALPPVAAPAIAEATLELAEEEPAEAEPEDSHPALERYAQLSRYPGGTRRLRATSTDLLNPNMRHERRMPLGDPNDSENAGWEVRYTADRYFVRGDEPLHVQLELWNRGNPVRPSTLSIQAERRNTSSGERPVVLRTKTRDFESTAEFTPNDYWPDHLGLISVEATFTAPGLSEKTGKLAFFFTAEDRIPGTFSGSFSDRLENGSLLIEIGTEIKTAGTYRVAGNLYDSRGEPVAWSQFEGELQPGQRRVQLEFYGLIFHDAAARPPFTLGQIRGYRMRRGDSPDRESMPDYPGHYQTQTPYALSDFRRDEHDSPKKQHMRELYRDALARGVKLTRPTDVAEN